MLVFVDESGDPGLKLGQGSTPHFVVTLVIFKDLRVTERVNKAIKAYRVKINFYSQAEFHFTKLKDTYRIGFLEAVAPFEFEYYSIVINKEKLKGPGFHFKNSFYKYSCRLVMNNAKKVLSNASVIIDGSGDRKFRRELAEYFRKQVNDADNPNRVVKVQMHDSKSDDLVQLADMICGAVARSYSDKPDAKLYRQIIQKREAEVQFWPG
jgi:hypothetical protein